MNLKVTIITATFNSAATIETCMQSVLDQTYPHIEYLIIDGHSKDDTLDKVTALAEGHTSIKVISESDKGIYDALNKGIALATGDVIGFVHSDDMLSEDTIISKLVAAFFNYNVDGVYGNLHYVKTDDLGQVVRHWKSEPFQKRLLNRGWMPAHPTLFLKRQMYETHGDFNLDYTIAADYDFVLRIFKQPHLKFYYLDQVVTKMRVGGISNKNMKNLILKTKEDFNALRSHGFKYVIKIVVLKNVLKIPQWIFK